MLDRIRKAVRRRPVRVVEAVLALVAAVGVAVTPEAEAAVRAIIAALGAVGVVGGEVVQRRTTPLAEPRLSGPQDHHTPQDVG